MGGQRERARGGCGFSTLVKQSPKGKSYAVFCFAGKENYFFYIYDVINMGKRKKKASNLTTYIHTYIYTYVCMNYNMYKRQFFKSHFRSNFF